MRFLSLGLLLAAVLRPAFASLDERQDDTSLSSERPVPSSAVLGSAFSSAPTSTTSVFSAPTSLPAPNINSSVYDLSEHFCRVWRHASVFADDKVYIDGGNTYVPRNGRTYYNTEAGDHIPGMHTQLLVLDLSKNFTNQESGPYSSVFKAPDVPNGLIEHAMWYSESTRKIYQLGGWFSFNNEQNPSYLSNKAMPEPAVWEFDIDTERWAKSTDFEVSNNGEVVDRPGAAAFCDAPSLNRSYIFEGYTQLRSGPANAQYVASSDFRFLEGMLELDTADASQPKLTNISVPTYMGPRMNGAMVHVPVGDKGIIVNIGGQTTRDETPFGARIQGANAGNINIELSFVDIYDIETGFWFRQQTFGQPDMPTGRSDICAVLVPADDESSWNIYVVAGVENYATYATSEEIWVLTLPTFQWIMVHERAGGLYGHTCHVAGDNLLVVGGMQTADGKNAGTCAGHMPVEIFSLAAQNYTGRYDANAAKKLAPVPSKVVGVIGGTASGGAVVRAPRAWSHVYLQYIFDPSLSRPEYTPSYTLVVEPSGTTTPSTTPSTEPGGSSKGAIIGGVVGGVLGAVALVGIGVFFFLRRRKKGRQAEAAAAAAAVQASRQSHMSELPGYTPYSSPEPKPGFAISPTTSPGPHAAELEVPPSASEMPSSPRHGGSVEMGTSPTYGGSDATQSPRMGDVSPTYGSEGGHAHGGRPGRHSPGM